MRLGYALVALALSAAPAFAQTPAATTAPAGAYVNDRTHTSVTWRVQHQGLAFYTARFVSVDIQLDFDPADVSKSKVSASIDPKSVETDFMRSKPATDTRPDFNAEFATEKFFNAAKFPTITFKSTKITKTAANKGKMTGDLTFMGVTKPVTLDVTYDGNRPDPRLQKHKVGFSATGVVKRSEFGMSFATSIAGDDVQLQIEAELVQK